jgi:hypothetical protein
LDGLLFQNEGVVTIALLGLSTSGIMICTSREGRNRPRLQL